MKAVFGILFAVLFVQSSFANDHDKGLELLKLDCIGANGVIYKTTQSRADQLVIETSYAGVKKEFRAKGSVDEASILTIELSSDPKAEKADYRMVLTLSTNDLERQQTVGMIYSTAFGTLVPVSAVSCTVQHEKVRIQE